MIPAELKSVHKDFWDSHHQQYDMTTNEGCGQYTESFVRYAQNNGFSKVGHLKKNPGQTQYNGHANDAFLYADGEGNIDGLFQAVDIIANAESKPPYTPSHQPPSVGWTVDIPRYTIKDWMKEPGNVPNPQPTPDMVPYVGYWGDPSSDKLMRTLMYDFFRRPENYNPGMGRWISRAIHSATIGPVPPSQGGQPLGFDGALARHRPEWCQALGGLNPNDPVPDSFFPEYKH